MSEISMYEAQKKKLQGLCDEHDLVFRFIKDRYPITLTIKPVQGMDAQISMLENVEEVGYRSPDASMTWIFEDGVLETKVTGGTFTISKTLRGKIENVLVKMIAYWQQYFFRDVMEKNALRPGVMPVIDEDEADDREAPPMPEGAELLEEYEDDGEIPGDEELDEDDPDIQEAMDSKLDKQQAVMETKMDELTREVREHNNFAKRMPVVEEQIKVINHRIEDLEEYHKGA